MALRAAGLDGPERSSLESIASDHGVSRETVRRARNELLQSLESQPGATSDLAYSLLSVHAPSEPTADSPATARALRRLLTITGPLPWDEVMGAWARAGGKPPYSPLPSDVPSMRRWAKEVGGLEISGTEPNAQKTTIGVTSAEELDRVGRFLLDTLGGQVGGIDRNELLELAENAGLKRTTIATTLSIHPAVMRVRRGMWALRGQRQEEAIRPSPMRSRRSKRVRPTTFNWNSDGSLLIEFSLPQGPSPVIAVPRAVSEIIEGREFQVEREGKPMHVTVRNAKLWGFGPLLSEPKTPSGTRVTIALDLMAGTANINAEGKGTSR